MAIEPDKVYGLKGSQVEDLADRVKNNADDIAGLETTVAGKQDALTQAQLSAVNSGIDSTKVAQIATNTTDINSNYVEIDAIKSKIPAQASSSNQLADKDFVNSSVATNTANFVGTFNSLAELEAVQNPTNNDYGFVISTSGGNTVYNRYKFNGTAWAFEYALNNSSFTAEQWAAIQSGITSSAVAKLADIPADAEANTIDSISVNGTAVTPDANKNVDLTIGGGIKTLTTADYNWPVNNPTSIAPWLLDAGLYKLDVNLEFKLLRSAGYTDTVRAGAVIVGKNSTYTTLIIPIQNGRPVLLIYNSSTGASVFSPTAVAGGILTLSEIVDHLASTVATVPLSANQGRVLKDLVDTKQDAITMTDTDPGEGAALAAGKFIAVYDGGNS